LPSGRTPHHQGTESERLARGLFAGEVRPLGLLIRYVYPDGY
jgi:hypothetical protein